MLFFSSLEARPDSSRQRVDMIMHVKQHSGYAAVGFSESGGMKGADIIVAAQHDGGAPGFFETLF